MAVLSSTDLYSPEIVTDAMRGALKGKNGLMGSIIVSAGAVKVSGTMPKGGKAAIGKQIDMPYWNTLGDFETLTESQSPTPQKMGQGFESATVARKSIAYESSTWAQGVAAMAGSEDPVQILAEEAAKSAVRAMDSIMIAEAQNSPLVYSNYSATAPQYLTWQKMLRAVANKMGDESPGIVALACHSLVAADLTLQTDAQGRQYLADPGSKMVAEKVIGIPIIVSDRMPLTGSSMSTVTGPFTTALGSAAGSGSATYTIAVTDVTKMGAWKLVIEVLSTGECGTATIRFSTDEGNTWSAAITTAATTAATSLVDTAVDSLVGNNGQTGVSITFTSGGGNDLVDGEFYRSTANLCCESQIWMPGAGTFWYNEAALALKVDEDIMEDTDLGAMHLYYAPKVYRRRSGGSRPGVLRLKSNVGDFIGGSFATS
jgi:hypothetical protein